MSKDRVVPNKELDDAIGYRTGSLTDVRNAAREYFQRRDALEHQKAVLLAAMLDATEIGDAYQRELTEACDLREENEAWQFHRTRIQQFLDVARRQARV